MAVERGESDEVRAAVLATGDVRKELIEHNGKRIYVREPSLATAQKLGKLTDPIEIGLEAAILSCHLVTSSDELGQRLFGDKDRETLKQLGAGKTSLIRKVTDALGRLQKAGEATEETDAKNTSATT